ncbi:MAG: GWxTD domain-containing protein [Desulfobulbaceae bacterium]|nr:GWxTD domain-containing protein [Candidatus Kapabacteria bacterium]MBS4001523.1 GWxTD domain-containing protein [Desulfobulbaceae bacterium]
MKLTLTIISMIFLFHLQSIAQGFSDRSSYYSYGTKMYAESFYQPIADNDSIEVTLMFKIVHHTLGFIKSNSNDKENHFFATPSLEIIIKDSDGIIRNRIRWKDTIHVNNYDDTESKDKFAIGYVQFNMMPGSYNSSISLLDSYDKKTHSIDLKLNPEDFSRKPLISNPVFVTKNAGISDYIYYPFILGGNVAFSAENSTILLPLSYSTDFDSFNFILQSKANSEMLYNVDDFKLSGRMELIQSDGLVMNEEPLFIKIADFTDKLFDLNYGMLRLELPEQSLLPGDYTLAVYKDGSRDTSLIEFKVLWHDMPLSLRDLDYAINSTFYLLSDEAFELMNSGNKEEKRKKFLEFWKSKDPTPLTPYNEALTQYFSRVDYAFFNFQTLTQRDGSKTDKGKIYILFGLPDNMKKELINAQSFDVWRYSSLGKTFYFESQTKGIFKLTKIVE